MSSDAAGKNGVAGAVDGLITRLRPYTGLVALFALCLVFGLSGPAFLTPANFFNILNAVAIFGILAVGQAFPLIGGGFDLSQGAVASLTGAVTASLLSRYGQPIPVAVATGLALGLVLGAINGTLIARAGINPFVATLGTQITFFGITNVYTNNQPQALGPFKDQVRQLAISGVGPFTWAALLFLALVVLLGFVLRRTAYGQHLYVLGGNEEAGRLAGLDTARLKISTYMLSGLMGSVAGLVIIARSSQASPTAAVGYELESLASCIIGGIALGGGVGGAWNVLLGAITLVVIDNGLSMSGHAISSNWRLVIRGVIILLAVAADARARLRR